MADTPAEKIEDMIVDYLVNMEDEDSNITSLVSYSGSKNKDGNGMTIKLADGSEFEVTIVKTK